MSLALRFLGVRGLGQRALWAGGDTKTDGLWSLGLDMQGPHARAYNPKGLKAMFLGGCTSRWGLGKARLGNLRTCGIDFGALSRAISRRSGRQVAMGP